MGAFNRARPAFTFGVVWALLCVSPARAQQAPPAIDRLGERITIHDVHAAIAFRPFRLPRPILGIAVLPPFHGADSRASRGIAFEYRSETGTSYVFSQWPRNGGSLARYPLIDEGDAACPSARVVTRGAAGDGIVWTTPGGLVSSLIPDGRSDAPNVYAEWRKLIRRGACR